MLFAAACGNEPDPPASRQNSEDSGSFTFLDIGKGTRINRAMRDRLEEILGDAAVERRGILNLAINHKAFLQDHFPDLDRMNRQLNSDIGLRVKHRIIRRMYRYARQKGLPYDLVELVYTEKTGRPLLIRLQFRTGAEDTLRTLEKKYGLPQTLQWGAENAETRFWEHGGDYLLYSVVPRRGYKVEYRVVIFYTDAIKALIHAEASQGETAASGKTGF